MNDVTRLANRAPEITAELRQNMLDGLAQGKYHTEIADDLIELSDDLVKSDAVFLTKTIAQLARSPEWKTYIEEVRKQDLSLLVNIPISTPLVRLERLEQLYQKQAKPQLEKIIVDPDGGIHRIFKDNTPNILKIVAESRKEVGIITGDENDGGSGENGKEAAVPITLVQSDETGIWEGNDDDDDE